MNIKEITELTKDFCFNYRSPSTYSHDMFQSDFLRKIGCRVVEEYEIIFDNVRANGDIFEQRGFLDLLVFYEQMKIAMEFDNGNLLKLKSTSKLLQSETDMIIGIIRGNQRYNVWYRNMRRIKYVMKRLRIHRRPILLIINSHKSASWIDGLDY